jgi:excisionase family DNA binding protein
MNYHLLYRDSKRKQTMQRKKNPTGMQETLMTIEQVAEYLRIDKFTVYRLVTQKRIPAFKVGSQWRFKQDLIEDWLRKNSNIES